MSEQQQSIVLDRTWSDPRGLLGWLSAVNHKAISRRFIFTTVGFSSRAVRSPGSCGCSSSGPTIMYSGRTSTTSCSPCTVRR
jgi:hypothetical protein